MNVKPILLWLLAASAATAAADTFTGGISLDKTVKLAQQPIALPDGNPQPILALAARHGQAKGYFSGKAAEAVANNLDAPYPSMCRL